VNKFVKKFYNFNFFDMQWSFPYSDKYFTI
jgi:hypothetical protein